MIPDGWQIQDLTDVALIILGQSPPSSACNETVKGYPFYQGNADFGHRHPLPQRWIENPLKIAKKDDLLISVRAPVGELNIANTDCCIGRGLGAIRPLSANRDFVYYTLLNARNSLASVSQGSTFDAINGKELRNLHILMPPLPEQIKIAAILNSVDDAIQATQAVIDQTRRVKLGLLHQLLTRGIGHTRFKQTEIGEIPEEWEVMAVNEIVSLMKSGLSRRIVPQDIGIPVLISGNIQNGKLDTKELKFWYEKDPQGARVGDYILKDGDILLCFINSLKQIGKLCIYEDIGRSAIYTTNLFRIQLKQTYSPNFGYYIFSAPFFQKEIDLITKPAVNQASFTKADFLRILIPIPPKEERDKIVKILESVDYNLETAQIQLRTVQKLKRGLMQDLLTGRMRVKPYEVNTT